jgi:dihydroxy-acid dehydratase
MRWVSKQTPAPWPRTGPATTASGGPSSRRASARATRGLCIGHVGPEAQVGGPIALVEDGDIISIDADAGTIELEVDPIDLEHRAKSWEPRPTNYGSGAIWKFAQAVGPACNGAVTHPGAEGETHVYADL